MGQQSIEGFLKPPSTSKKRPREDDLANQTYGGASSSILDKGSLDNAAYLCRRCGKSIQLPKTSGDQSLSSDHEDALAKVKLEHDDFHFAQDLASEGKPHSTISVSKSGNAVGATKPGKRRKPPPEPKGIEKFFRK